MFESKAAPAAKYPLHEKLKLLAGQQIVLSGFLDWLDSQGLTICLWDTNFEEYRIARLSKEALLGKYFEIDPKALAAEKDAMYDEMQRMRAAE